MSADEQADHDFGTAELHFAIELLCAHEHQCLDVPDNSLDECVNFLWDVAQHSYPNDCYAVAADYAQCLSSQPCNASADFGCDAYERELAVCCDAASVPFFER